MKAKQKAARASVGPSGRAPSEASRGAPQGPPPSSVGRLLVALGTYDGGLLGYRLEVLDNGQSRKAQEAHIQRLFAVRAHAGCVKALCTPGKFLVSGGTDETLRAYDLDALEEQGSARALEQRGIEALAAGGPSACVSLSEEGALRVWRVTDWQLLKVVNVKRGGRSLKASQLKLKSLEVQSRCAQQLSVHPRAGLALCLGGSNAVQLVDLVKGRLAAAIAVDEAPLDVRWSLDGSLFAILSAKTAKILGTGGDCRATLRSEKDAPWASMAFGFRGFFFLGTSAGHVECFLFPAQADAGDAKGAHRGGASGAPQDAVCVASEKQHRSRVKALAAAQLKVAGTKSQQILASCDSSGLVVLWVLEEHTKKHKPELRVLTTTETRCRLTCLAMSAHCGARREKVQLSSSAADPEAAAAAAASPATEAGETPRAAKAAQAAAGPANASLKPPCKRKEQTAEPLAASPLSRGDGERLKGLSLERKRTRKKRRVT